MPPEPPTVALPSIAELQQKTLEKFGCTPCRWQCDVALALLAGKQDVICISGTGSGKTLPFWMPLLFRPDGIQVVVTPLNILGSQNQNKLQALGIPAINVTADNATAKTIEDILACKYRVVVVNPEIAFKPRGVFERVWKSMAFMTRVISIVWDEAHLIKAWSSFRPELGQAADLRDMVCTPTLFLLASATMSERTLSDVKPLARIQDDRVKLVRRSNDRPNVYLTVRKIRHPLSTFRDLEFLIPQGWVPGTRLPHFLVFFNDIEESIRATEVLRRRLPPAFRDRIVWFNADNTPTFRECATADYLAHQLFGLCCTDAFGMGVDIPDIELIVQWRVGSTMSLDTIWQRFGRGARGPGTEAVAVLFVDAKYFDEEREAAAERAAKRKEKDAKKAAEAEKNKRKRLEGAPEEGRSKKRARRGNELTDGGVAQHVRGSDGAQAAAGPSASDSTPPGQGDLSAFEQLRVLYRQDSRKDQEERRGKSKKGTAATETLAPEVDSLVNAATRAHIKCYRKPITAYYENDRAVCKPGSECARCALRPSAVCCSLCTPDHPLFRYIPSGDTPLEKTSVPRASQIDKNHKMDATDFRFRDALNAFRREETRKKHGIAHLNNLGPGDFMGNDVLKRIVDCAHANKIRSLESLYRETKWHLAREHGTSVLELINRYVSDHMKCNAMLTLSVLQVLPSSDRRTKCGEE
ncbi:P-loop containing nucleoside triphosphate hydrolase protein [Cerioporus squamosus]|nr:P-loop containing nucleoside triphosphate hydrolase protein [Cerioporus squamosus]